MCMMRVVIAPNGFFLSCKSRFILVQKPDPSLVRFTVFFCGVQVCPEVWASFDLTGVLRLRRRLKGWMDRNHQVPPSQSRWSLPTTPVRRAARRCCPTCTSRPTDATQARWHSRPRDSGTRWHTLTALELTLTRVWFHCFCVSGWIICSTWHMESRGRLIWAAACGKSIKAVSWGF